MIGWLIFLVIIGLLVCKRIKLGKLFWCKFALHSYPPWSEATKETYSTYYRQTTYCKYCNKRKENLT